ncbi:hypothetical protein J6590_095189 [Homalodisca vitripennis]|nr:hypothetical protein J6590_095189 [Homalodisca vitripennis]
MAADAYRVSVKPDVYNTGQIEGKVKSFSAVAKATNSNNLTIESRTFDSTIDNATVPNSQTCGENVESKVLVDERFPNALDVVSDYRRGTEKKAFSQKTRNFSGVGDNNNRGRQQEVRSFSNSNRVFTKSSSEWTAVNYRKSGWNNNYKKRSEGYSINGSKMDSNISIVPDTGGKERPATGSAPTYSDILRSEVKNKVVRGTLKVSDSNPLKPAKRMRWLFLSGLDPVVSAQSITDYLHSLKEVPNDPPEVQEPLQILLGTCEAELFGPQNCKPHEAKLSECHVTLGNIAEACFCCPPSGMAVATADVQ